MPDMKENYKESIQSLIASMPFDIDTDLEVGGRRPSPASSQFLTNKEQGDWAEKVALNAINEYSGEYWALAYGRDDTLSAGDPGFAEFYRRYQDELNVIGKKPDLLIFHRGDIDDIEENVDLDDPNVVSKAVAAIEVRSSSFLAGKYSEFMEKRTRDAEKECEALRKTLLQEPYVSLMEKKRPEVLKMIRNANASTFHELDFRASSWSSSEDLKRMSETLKQLKSQIEILHKRGFLSITPKLEDIALVNRWIQNFGVPHYYLQVFFDKAYVIPFKDILEICSDPEKEGSVFTVKEKDVKNQRKTTIKINIEVGKEVIGRIDMPDHKSKLKELDRGRLLFYVTFEGGKGYLDPTMFNQEIINDS